MTSTPHNIADANGTLLRNNSFENIWFQPATGDAGGVLGARQFAYHHSQGQPRKLNGVMDGMRESYLGLEYSQEQFEASLTASGGKFKVLSEEAFRCFTGTGIEILIYKNCFLVKEDQDPELAEDYKDKFELD